MEGDFGQSLAAKANPTLAILEIDEVGGLIQKCLEIAGELAQHALGTLAFRDIPEFPEDEAPLGGIDDLAGNQVRQNLATHHEVSLEILHPRGAP